MSIYSTSHGLKIFEDHNTSLYKISQLIPQKTKNVLDVGCSSGYLGQYVKLHTKNKIQYDGIEIDKHDRNLAKKYLDNVINIDIQNKAKLNKMIQKYDAIIFADVLEHTVKPSSVLSNFVKKLNPNGTVLISVPNITHQSIILELLSGQWNYEKSGLLDSTHLHFFDYNEIIKIVEENNLYINKIDFSIFDIPHQKIVSIAKSQGITNPSELLTLLKRPQHKIFQFIISANNKKPLDYISYRNNHKVLKPISDWINEWEILINKLQSNTLPSIEIDNNVYYINKINTLEEELKKIKSSKLYSLFEKVKSIVKLITNHE